MQKSVNVSVPLLKNSALPGCQVAKGFKKSEPFLQITIDGGKARAQSRSVGTGEKPFSQNRAAAKLIPAHLTWRNVAGG